MGTQTASRQHQPTWTKHSPAELAYSHHEGRVWFYFVSDSASTEGKVNTTGYRPADGATTCDCRAARTGRDCWHRALVGQAWTADYCRRVAERQVVDMTDGELVENGIRAAALVERGRRCAVFASPLDSAMLTSCRAEWLRRRAASRRPARPLVELVRIPVVQVEAA